MRSAERGDTVLQISTGSVAEVTNYKNDGRLVTDKGLWERWDTVVVCPQCAQNTLKDNRTICDECDAEAKHWNGHG